MQTISDFDRLRAWAEGKLSPEQSAELECELARNGTLRKMAEDLRDVWALTAVRLGHTPSTDLTVETIFARLAREERDDATRRRWRRVAGLAAALAAAAGIAFVILHRGASQAHTNSAGPVVLQAIRLDDAPPASDSAVPAILDQELELLADYAPVESGQIRWLDSLDAGTATARATGRPLFLFGFYPGCPWCAEMRADALSDPTVQKLFERFVPVGLDLTQIDRDTAIDLMGRGYPFLEVEDADGRILYSMHGKWDADEFRAHLERALGQESTPHATLEWDRVRELARALQVARDDERNGRMGGAFASYVQLAARGGGLALAAEGERGQRRVAQSALAVLLDARERAHLDVPAAENTLVAGVERFAGSPFARDFDAVLERLRTSRRFPELATP